MPLGDSITAGVRVRGGYRSDLWQLMNASSPGVDFVGSSASGPVELRDRDHEGHPGWEIAQLDARVRGWLTHYRPDIVLLHIGTNDVLRPRPGRARRRGCPRCSATSPRRCRPRRSTWPRSSRSGGRRRPAGAALQRRGHPARPGQGRGRPARAPGRHALRARPQGPDRRRDPPQQGGLLRDGHPLVRGPARDGRDPLAGRDRRAYLGQRRRAPHRPPRDGNRQGRIPQLSRQLRGILGTERLHGLAPGVRTRRERHEDHLHADRHGQRPTGRGRSATRLRLGPLDHHARSPRGCAPEPTRCASLTRRAPPNWTRSTSRPGFADADSAPDGVAVEEGRSKRGQRVQDRALSDSPRARGSGRRRAAGRCAAGAGRAVRRTGGPGMPRSGWRPPRWRGPHAGPSASRAV